VKGFDRSNDVALLQIQGASNLPIVQLGDSDRLQVGDDVIAVGNALNLAGGPTVTEGIVSAKGRTVDPTAPPNLIQTDAAINPGNSGGPLVNTNGEVVGMNTLVIQQANSQEAAQNLGFAIPVNSIKPLLPELAAGVQRTPGYLGVGTLTLTPDIARRYGISASQGAIIQDIPSDAPAARAGLQQLDVITSIDGNAVTSDTALVQLIRARKPGDKVSVGYVFHGGRPFAVTVNPEVEGDSAPVVVEPLAALAPEEPPLHHAAEQRRGGVHRFLELFVQRVRHRVGRVQADQIEQRQRTHRMSTAIHHPEVDVLGAREPRLEHTYGREEVGNEESVDDESGAVWRVDDVLAQRVPSEGFGPGSGHVAGAERRDQFDEVHERNRIEEMQSDN
jgi:hypothetical protein